MICFVYRSPYEGVAGKHVRWLPDDTVLDWFRRGWDEATADPEAWLLAELGVDVYGLDSVFEAAAEHGLPKPRSTKQLRKILNRHLYVEGKVRADELSVRAMTDDDENPLAYFFLDRRLFAAHADRLAYAAHEDWPLPADTPEPGGTAPVTTVVMSLLGDVDWDTQGAVVRFPGVRLPEFARHLRGTAVDEDWPAELSVLRAAVGPDDDLEQALRLMNRWAAWNDQYLDVTGLDGEHAEAHRIARSVLADVAGLDEVPGPLGVRRPGRGRIDVAQHIAQAAFHLDDEFGYQQVFAFDDVWAANHRYLASSLLRWYSGKWDPLKGAAGLPPA
ncbi:hypothetical protein OHA72_49025 [Dactylosporangium sp. NBC_01737]|uniref:hypothetical protein n=1 Tax=Dactylosporangium sp. NBC_01737 TaxID=2975959 RepID=UPI002E1187A9|nr:hypothetical protein OHA72_49025 [Dactylosporangium sp. NBC_01737]